jgi:hypothetical protein
MQTMGMTSHSKPTSQAEKLGIYQVTAARHNDWYQHRHEQGGQCLYWSLTLMAVLLERGYRALIQAGSMSWPIVPRREDDGKIPTHFSYECSPWRAESQAALGLGLLPEIHVWVGLPDQNQLLDFSTKFLPKQAAQEGLVWRTPPPPDFLWCSPSELPDGVIYKPTLDAIGFILNRIQKGAQCRTRV